MSGTSNVSDDDAAGAVDAPRAKTLRPLPIDGAPPDVVPARMVNEVLYCERLVYLEWAQKEFADNFYTVEGRTVTHRKVDGSAQAPAGPDATGRPWQARSVWLTSERLGLTAKIDIVEADGDGWVAPVEYKRGKKPAVEGGAWLPERAQLCAQVLLLRDHGYRCDEAWIWFAGSRDKVAIAIDDVLVAQTLKAIARVREVTATPQIPPPLQNDRRCRGCSLAGLCLPDEVNLLKAREVSHGGQTPLAPRRLQPASDERSPLYVQESGATVGVQKHRIRVRSRSGEVSFVRLPNTSQVCLYGNVQVSTQAMRALLSAGIPVAFFSTGGWFLGRTIANDSNNVELRTAQYRAHLDDPWRLQLACSLVHNKISINARCFGATTRVRPKAPSSSSSNSRARRRVLAPAHRCWVSRGPRRGSTLGHSPVC